MKIGLINKGSHTKRNKVFSIFCCFDDFEKKQNLLEKYYENRVFTGNGTIIVLIGQIFGLCLFQN